MRPRRRSRLPADHRQMINTIIVSVLGWTLDPVDLFILLYAAPVIGALFFPSTNAALSLAAVYAFFVVLSIFSCAIFLYLIGALTVPETKGTFIERTEAVGLRQA